MKNKIIRKPLIAGNWKMNKNVHDAKDLAEEIVEKVGRETDVNILVCPPFTALSEVAKALEGSNILLGAQNLYPASSGAFTGEISPDMLRTLFVTYVIVGHSERRGLFGETDVFINRKIVSALETSLKPILCVGETLDQRMQGNTQNVIQSQLENGLKNVDLAKAEHITIAYEPIWAIGTGKNATPEMAQEVHASIREFLESLWGEAIAQKVRILYGGSMNSTNAAALLSMPDVDGGLIGGASLESKGFVKIVEDALTLCG